MPAFFKWLQETKKENKPDMLGFIVQYLERIIPGSAYGGFRPVDSKIFKTYVQALNEKKRIFNQTTRIGNILAIFADKTLRPIFPNYNGGSNWHFNRAGRIVNDHTVKSTGRGRTNHSYLAKDDPNFQIYNAIAYLRHEMIPGNMPGQSGKYAPEGFWDHVNSAIAVCTEKVNLSYMGMLYDFIGENYPHDDPNVATCRMIIRDVLNHYGQAIPPDPELD